MAGRLALLALLAALCLFTWTSCGGGGGGGNTPRPLLADFLFFQVGITTGWMDAGVPVVTYEQASTRYGALEVQHTAPSGVCYLNLVVDAPTGAEWELRNLPLLSRGIGTLASPEVVTVPFDVLHEGPPVGTLTVAVVLTDLPLDATPATFEAVPLLGRLQVLFSGEEGFIPAGPDLWPDPLPPSPFPDIEAFGFVAGPPFPNQDVGLAECVPGAISNSLQYLGLTQQVGVDDMKPVTGWGANGAPTGPAGSAWWDKKATNTAGPPWNVNTNVNQQNGTVADRVADFDQMITDLDAGKDVEVRIPGHAACVTGCVKVEVDGQTYYFLQVAHDTDQGNAGGQETQMVCYDPLTNTYTGGWLFDGASHDRTVTESR